jgi:hypothetical protein
MKNKLNFLLFLTLFQSFAFGQIKLSGTIINNTTRQAIEYANIGILEKEVGTVCSSLGKFDLLVPNELLNDSLTISSLGYESETIKISNIKNNPTDLVIELKPKAILLQELTVSASAQVSLGYRPNGNQVTGFFKASGLGLEGGTLIRNTGKVTLTQFNLNILKIPFDTLKFRLNFYSVKKDKPFVQINTKDIIFTISRADTGFYSLPLVNENIQVSDNFICTIELIELFGKPAENAEFLFSAIPNKDGFIYKKAISLGNWDRIKKYSLCFWLVGEK